MHIMWLNYLQRKYVRELQDECRVCKCYWSENCWIHIKELRYLNIIK